MKCGPLEVDIHSDDAFLRSQAFDFLGLYDAAWDGPFRRTVIRLKRGTAMVGATGTFLASGRMAVDISESAIAATTADGVCALARLHERGEDWFVEVPDVELSVPLLLDIEHALALALTTGWRRAGWVPLHAGAIEKDGRCLLLCAPSGGGKSTFAAALVRAGWRTLGDDKLLLRVREGVPEVKALASTFSLDPRTALAGASQWGLDALAPYSAGCEKRRLPVDAISAGAMLSSGRPTHILHILRDANRFGLSVDALPDYEAAPALLRQIVIPRDRIVAAAILDTAVRAARAIKPMRAIVGDVARPNDWARALEEKLACPILR